jgi:CDP-glycerol glycerophosphotransferase (TagB/SpsB family)
MLDYLRKEQSRIDLFICGALPEYNFILNEFGYNKTTAKYTGFARFDKFFDSTEKKKNKSVLVMPTWRRNADKKNLVESDYFSTWQALLRNEELTALLERYGYSLNFYLHPLFQKYSNLFTSKNSRINICSSENYDIQELLISSKLLVTDYSSVFFDFSFMNKPLIYYQFDKDYFQSSHYKKGYFNYDKDGFGPVAYDVKSLMHYLEEYFANDCMLEDVYKKRSDDFFPLKDNLNCYRIYNAIKELHK